MRLLRSPVPPSVRAAFAMALLGAASCGGGGGGGGGVAPGGGIGTGAELVPTDVTLSAAILTAGESLTVGDTVENRGDRAASGFQVGIYLSTDALVDVTDVLLGFRTIGNLDAGMSSTGGASLTIPLATPAGDYFVGAIADDLDTVSEPNEGNNVMRAPGTLAVEAAKLPDLSVTAVSFSPLALEAGEDLQVDETVANDGAVDASGVVVGVYLSSDATISSADVLLGFRTVASLMPGESSSSSGALTVPSSLFAGNYWVGVLVDDGDLNTESNETNNSRTAPVQVRVDAPPRADLAASGLAFGPSAIDAGQTIQVSDGIANQGVADAGPFRVGIYLSSDSAITSDDRLIAVRTLPGLPQGISSTVSSVPAVVPIETPGGEWFVGILVDDLEAVVETNESNNGLAALGKLTVRVPPTPDLAVTSIAFTPSAVTPSAGEKLTVTDAVRNQGVLAAGAFRVGFYLSSNPVVSKGDIFLGSRSVSALAVGDSSSGSTVLSLPAGLGAGSWFVGAIANDDLAVLEVFSKNNQLTASTPLDVIDAPMPMPQLKAVHVSFDPSVGVPGGEIQIEDTVRNLGTQSAAGFWVGIYLSMDDDVTTDDVLLGERFVANLPISFGSAASAPYRIPLGTAPGTYRIGVICDNGALIAESNEDDNVLVALGKLTVN